MTLETNSSTSLLENHFYAIEMPQREHSVSDAPYGGTLTKLGKLTDPSNLDLLGLRSPFLPQASHHCVQASVSQP